MCTDPPPLSASPCCPFHSASHNPVALSNFLVSPHKTSTQFYWIFFPRSESQKLCSSTSFSPSLQQSARCYWKRLFVESHKATQVFCLYTLLVTSLFDSARPQHEECYFFTPVLSFPNLQSHGPDAVLV